MTTLHKESYLCQGETKCRLKLKSLSRNELLATVLLYVKNEEEDG